jgi:hypothetical protein
MIIADRFLWLHLPKTGGTTMNRVFRELALPGVVMDPDDTRAKHDSVSLREQSGSWRAGARRRFINSRSLPAWLVSDWCHKQRHMGLDLPFEPVTCGLFYSLRLGGVWVAADWWLRYFEINSATTALRLEHLTEDFNTLLLPLLPPGTPPLVEPPRENKAREGSRPAPRSLDPAEIETIYACNPLWLDWETRVYGHDPRVASNR